LTEAKNHPAFSTNHLADTDKTKQKQEQHKKLNKDTRKQLTYENQN